MIKRPILIACIGYILGIIYGLYFIKLSIAIFLGITVFIFILNRCLSKKIIRFTKIIISRKGITIFCIFSIIGCIYVTFLEGKYKEVYKIDEIIKVEGIVTKIEEQEFGNKYIIDVKSITGRKCKGIKFLMYTKKSENKLKYGDYIELSSEYTKPDHNKNFKGFSYRNYLKQGGIYGIIKPIGKVNVIRRNEYNFIYTISNNVRDIIMEKTSKNLSDEAKNVFLGILLGEKSQISNEINTYFKDSNMAHILAVSGAHVSYVILAMTIILNKTGKKISAISTIIVLVFFMTLANFTPSVVRACIMSIIALVAKILYRKSDIYNNLAISCLLILINNPYNIFNVGFQLSFLGTLGIVILNEKLSKIIKQKWLSKEHKKSKLYKINELILNMIVISVSVQLLIIPIMLINFNTLSLNFLISGIIVTPVFAGIMLIGILSLITGNLGIYLFPMLEILINLLVFISKFISHIPFLRIIVKTPNKLWIISYYIVLILIIFLSGEIATRLIKDKHIKRKLAKKIIIIVLSICLIGQWIQNFRFKELEIHFIDVGQGDSTLIITPYNKVILIDGGGSSKTDYDVGKNVLVPYLLDRRINKIDYMMVSHFDNDHCGGLMYVLETLKVKNILISKQANISKEYKEFIQLAKEKKINIIVVKQGDVIAIEKDVKLNVLYPPYQLNFDDLNNNSIVAKLVYKKFSMLFTGDIEKEAENKLIEKYSKDILKSTVLKVGHHGSNTSSTEDFIKLVNPKIALIGVGKDNNFGHPNADVLSRLESAKIYRTDLCGEISIRVNKRGEMYIFQNYTNNISNIN